MDFSTASECIEVEEADVDLLIDSLKKQENVRKNIANFHLLDAYKYRLLNLIGLGRDEREDALKKAKEEYNESKELSDKDYVKLKKDIKREIKEMGAEKKKRSSAHLAKEKESLIKPIKITVSDFILIISLGSTLFLVSGYLYHTFLLGYFGVNSSDFFSIADYIASSTDVILPSIIATILMLGFMLLGMDDGVYRRIHEEQFESEMKKDFLDWTMRILPYFLIVSIIYWYYHEGKILWFFIYVLFLIIAFSGIPKLSIWKYIENPIPILVVLLAFIYFGGHLAFKVKGDIEKIENGQYKKGYSIAFINDYKDISDYQFIMSNSTYIFLYGSINDQVIVLPKSSVKFIKFDKPMPSLFLKNESKKIGLD